MNIMIVFYDIETGTDQMTPYMLVFTLFYFNKDYKYIEDAVMRYAF